MFHVTSTINLVYLNEIYQASVYFLTKTYTMLVKNTDNLKTVISKTLRLSDLLDIKSKQITPDLIWSLSNSVSVHS